MIKQNDCDNICVLYDGINNSKIKVMKRKKYFRKKLTITRCIIATLR